MRVIEKSFCESVSAAGDSKEPSLTISPCPSNDGICATVSVDIPVNNNVSVGAGINAYVNSHGVNVTYPNTQIVFKW